MNGDTPGGLLPKSAWRVGERRVVPIPPGEPVATLARWEAFWAAVGAWDGPDLDEDLWGEVQALYARLVRFGVAIRPECAAFMQRREAAFDADRDDDDGQEDNSYH